jgi:hypothetical protein
MDVGAWLKSLGLEQYEAAFRANGVDAELLPRWGNGPAARLGG